MPAELSRLRKLVLAVAVLGLLVLADLGARRVAEAQLERRVRASVPRARSTSAHIASFPFLGRLLVSGHVSDLRVAAADVSVKGLRFASVAVDLHDVRVDRDRLVADRQIDLRSVGRSQATADITQDDLRTALGGLPVVLSDGRIGVTVGGVRAAVTVSVRDGRLRLSAAGVAVPVLTIPTLPLLPCVSQAVARPGRLHLSCEVDRVPEELLARANAKV